MIRKLYGSDTETIQKNREAYQSTKFRPSMIRLQTGTKIFRGLIISVSHLTR